MKVKKILCLLLSIAMIVAFVAACGTTEEPEVVPTPEAPPVETPVDTTPPPPDEPAEAKTLMVGYTEFTERFTPFFATTAYDVDVSDMTQVALLTTDRTGDIIFNGIEGETRNYNGTDYYYRGIANWLIDQKSDGTVDYNVTIRDDLVFSDGTPVTIDDAIFSFYVLADPDYDGSSVFYSVPVIGMNEFRTGVSSNINEKYTNLAYAILEATPENDDFSEWTQAHHDFFWSNFDASGLIFAQEIVDYCVAYQTHPDYAADFEACFSDAVAFGFYLWGFGEFDGDIFTTGVTGTEYNMAAGEFPTVEDYWNEIVAAYGYDLEGIGYETAGSDIVEMVIAKFVMSEGPKDPDAGGAVMHIEGIKKTGDYSMTITTEYFEATTIYQLGINISPLHYYGDASLYDYDSKMFGHPKGDLNIVREKSTFPLGAGAYKFLSYENGIVSFEANENYYKGEPKTKFIRFQIVPDTDKLAGIVSGSIDITDPNFSNDTVKSIMEYNSNGELTGDVVTTNTVENLGYGYMGIAADTINVGGVPDSPESKALRKALATVLAVYRDTVNNSYYGERASTIQYPISNTSWAAPRPSDSDYRLAFSLDVDGNPIYTDSMSEAERFDAALNAAIGYLKFAGYTWDEAAGVFTAAPAGAEMVYEFMIGADGTGDHPAYGVATAAKDAFATIGITIEVNDAAWSVLSGLLNNGGLEMWAAAWQATIDPDMIQVYHSDNVSPNGSNSYFITDSELDQLMFEARSSADQAFRKATYKRCLEIIMDWAVEVPNYQRLNAIIFSTERVNLSTITPDITTFWGWMMDIELIEMN